MTTEHLRAPSPVRGDAVDDLTALLPGQVVVPGDPDWDERRLPWARAIDQQPSALVFVHDPEDVVAAVRWAAHHGRTVSVQPVGHAATTALDGTVVLRTRGLKELHVDPVRRVARVGAGVTWGELLAACEPFGIVPLAGSNASPTVVGLALAGGLSWFGRSHGLVARDVLSLDVVPADGVRRAVTSSSDPDLFWALRGGGGDLAVVTAVDLVLHPAPHIYGGRLLWPVDHAREVLRGFLALARTAPPELTMWAHLLRFPPVPQIPEPLRGGAFAAIDLTYLGPADDAERAISSLRALRPPLLDTLGTVRVGQVGEIAAEPVDPLRSREMSALLRDLDEPDLDALLDVVGADSESPLVDVQLRHLGGAMAIEPAVPGAATSVSEPFNLFCLGVPIDDDVPPIDATFDRVTDALADVFSGRTFPSFLGVGTDPSRAYDTTTLDRLRGIKRTTDPHGVIRGNRPVLDPADGVPR